MVRRVAFRRVHGVLLAAAITFGAALPAQAQSVQDVPPNHWAYQAVIDLVRKGYLTVEDGRFNGNQPVDRFTLATVIARILNEFESEGIVPRSEQEVDTLRRVVNEFSAELVAANVKVEEVLARLDATSKNLAATDEKVSQVIAALAEMQQRASLLEQRLEERASAIEERLAAHGETDAQLAAEAAQLRQGLEELRASLVGMIESLRSENRDRIDALESALRQSLEEQGIELGNLEGQLSQAASTLEQEVARLQGALGEDAERLRQVQDEVSLAKSELGSLTQGVQAALNEIYTELNAQAEGLAAQQLTLQQHAANLSELRSRVDALAELEERLTRVQGRLDGVERQILAMQSQIGLSDEQLRELSDRLMQELESQFQHSFLLAGTVSRDLAALKEEFQSYRQQTERSLSTASQAQLFGIVGALLGLVALVN